MPKRYDVTIKGEPGEVLLSAFSDVTVRQAPGVTVLSADLDQAALHGLLERVADLGLELVGVSLRAAPGRPPQGASGDDVGGPPSGHRRSRRPQL